MAEKMSYWEKLRHPNWQKKRLEIMSRDNFKCRHCGDDQEVLNVHHTYYVKGADPWDYPGNALLTLCETCHKFAEARRLELLEAVGTLPREEVDAIIGLARCLAMAPGTATIHFSNMYEFCGMNFSSEFRDKLLAVSFGRDAALGGVAKFREGAAG